MSKTIGERAAEKLRANNYFIASHYFTDEEVDKSASSIIDKEVETQKLSLDKDTEHSKQRTRSTP